MRLRNLAVLFKGGGIFRKQEHLETNSPGIRRQLEIYRKGVLGIRPRFPVSPEELENKARSVLSREAYDYVAGGAGAEITIRKNREAFERIAILPRMLRDVAERSLEISVLGARFPYPFLLAPIGVQGIVHREGEVAVARAAASLGVPMVLSTASSRSLEEVADALGSVPRWYQLYWPKDPGIAKSFLHRASAAGYSAIVVTLDTTILAWRDRDIRNAYLPFLAAEGIANYTSDPVFRKGLDRSPEEFPMGAVRHFARNFSNPALTWKDLRWLRKQTNLPILLKGILHPDDARKAVRAGVDGIIVSNHGGRQLDGALAALDALPGIVSVAGRKLDVLFDSGIRRGSDVFKAMALGAKGVLLGRPYLWALAAAGEAGVRNFLQNFIADLDLTLGLAGCRSWKEVNSTFVKQEAY
ncbi:MAG: alpha-hydroxy-acid oxidizing protein [Ignavibacterium sp.]|jgi:isopentenyl diphosphate isomerase/L-lactate dehydrogenase-like FMN-dependent dehydrogenase